MAGGTGRKGDVAIRGEQLHRTSVGTSIAESVRGNERRRTRAKDRRRGRGMTELRASVCGASGGLAASCSQSVAPFSSQLLATELARAGAFALGSVGLPG